MGEADGKAAEIESGLGVEEGSCLLVILFADPEEGEVVLGVPY